MDMFQYDGILVYRSVYAPVRSNMFVLISGKEAVVFDPNENDELLQLFSEKGIDLVYILLTHGHYDHISGVLWLKEHTQVVVYCQERCADRLANIKRPLSRLVALVLVEQDRKDGGHRYKDFKASYEPFTIAADKTFDKKDRIVVGELDFKITSTPGHSEGSACYILNDLLVFTGDTLLENNTTITRFPGGNTDDYKKIALPYLQSLDKNLIVMPGHGDPFRMKDVRWQM